MPGVRARIVTPHFQFRPPARSSLDASGTLWLLRLRPAPTLTAAEAGRLLPAAAANLLTHIGAALVRVTGHIARRHTCPNMT